MDRDGQSEGLPTGSPWSAADVDGLDGQLPRPATLGAEQVPEQCVLCQTPEVVIAS